MSMGTPSQREVFIAVSFEHRQALDPSLSTISDVLTTHGFNPVIFADKQGTSDSGELMQQALTRIDSCVLFVAEATYKRIGVGIEAGYAKARGKRIIYLRHAESELSTTLQGIADHAILYTSLEELQTTLEEILR